MRTPENASVSAHFGDHPKKIQLWGSFQFLSVGLAVGAAYLVGAFVASALGLAAWSVRGDGHVPDGRGVRERGGRSGAKKELGLGREA